MIFGKLEFVQKHYRGLAKQFHVKHQNPNSLNYLCVRIMDKLEQHIESVIFASEQPISLKEIKDCLEQSMETKLKKSLLETAMENIVRKYNDESYAFEIVEISNGYQFLTKGAYHHTVGVLLKRKAKKRLSKAALETLAIIAYRQPTTKSEAEAIRGVSCDYSIQKLLEKELITIIGRGDGPGKPLLYSTSEKFMNYFGLKSIADLPKLKDFNLGENTIGEAADIEEAIPQNAAEEIVVTEHNETREEGEEAPIEINLEEAEVIEDNETQEGGKGTPAEITLEETGSIEEVTEDHTEPIQDEKEEKETDE